MGNSICGGCIVGVICWLWIYECTSNKLIWLRGCNYVSMNIRLQLDKLLDLKCDFSVAKATVRLSVCPSEIKTEIMNAY